MSRRGKTRLNNLHWDWAQGTCLILLTMVFLSACSQTSGNIYEAGEKPIPPGIENQIHPQKTTQDEVLALLGEPVARMKEGSVHVFTYSYLDLQNPKNVTGESLTITFDDKNFIVLSVTRGPI
jgi:outer membrane protein assembly factor BamE (lipoprotein component of BamABCDE complex)